MAYTDNFTFEKITEIFTAGEQKRIQIGGDFFRVAQATGAVNVSLLSQGRVLGRMSNVSAGDYVKDVNFDGVIIESLAAQTAVFQISGGGVGSDSVVGTVSVSGTVNTKETGTALTNTYKSAGTNLLLANGVDTIFTPAANVNGAIIQSLEFISGNAASSQLGGFYVRATAPAAVTDSGAVLSARGYANFGSLNQFFGSKDTPLTIGAGLGLYFFSSFAEAYQIRAAAWTFL